VLIVLSLLFSWSKLLDHPAENYIDDSIKNAGLIYASSRAINAAVSVAQSANLGIGVSVTVGELLDPINDLIERFSAAMEIAITSLAMQKVLLLSVQHDIFNITLTIAGALFLLSLFTGKYPKLFFKVFTILFVIRISLVLILLANFGVDKLFLDEEIKAGQKNIESFQQEASAFAGTISNSEVDRMPNILEQLSITKEKTKTLQQKIKSLESDIANLETAMSQTKEKRSWWDLDLWTNDPETLRLKKETETAEAAIEEKQSQVEAANVEINTLKENLSCFEKHNQGETCSWSEKWQKITSKFDLSVVQASYAMNEKIDKVLSLMALVIIKSIIFPLLFWLLIYKLAKSVWTGKFNFELQPEPATKLAAE